MQWAANVVIPNPQNKTKNKTEHGLGSINALRMERKQQMCNDVSILANVTLRQPAS